MTRQAVAVLRQPPLRWPAPVWAGATAGLVVVAVGTVWAGPFHAVMAAALILLAIPAVWVLSSPSRALVVYAFAIPIDVYVSTTLHVTTTQLLQIAILAGWGLHWLLTPPAPAGTTERPVLPYRVGTALLLFLVASVAWAADPESSARTTTRIVAAMLLGVYAAEHGTRRTLPRLLVALCAGAAVTSIYGAMQWVRGGYDSLYPYFSPYYTDPFMSRGGGFAIVGTFANPNILAGFLLIVIPVAWSGLLGPLQRARFAWAATSLVLVTGLLLTFSKGSWLVLGLLATLWIIGRLPVGTTLSVGALIGLTASLVLFNLDSIWRMLLFLFPGSREASVDTRIALWWAALSVFLERPLLGFGADGFAAATAAVRSGPLADLTRAHNMYLQALVDHGVVGSALLWSTCGLILARAWRALREAPATREGQQHFGLLLGTSAFFFYGLVETLNVSNQYVNTVWLMLGLLAASTRILERHSPERR